MADGLFHCMTSIKCRRSNNTLRLPKVISSLATVHLAKRHRLVSQKGAALAEKRVGFSRLFWRGLTALMFFVFFVFNFVLILIHITCHTYIHLVFYLGFDF